MSGRNDVSPVVANPEKMSLMAPVCQARSFHVPGGVGLSRHDLIQFSPLTLGTEAIMTRIIQMRKGVSEK